MTEATENKDAATIAAVEERLRFFFSDANVRQDMFIRKLLLADEGLVPIETLLKFNTIKSHTEDPELIKKAASSEKLKDRIQLTEDGSAVKRVKPFSLDNMNDNIPLTLVVDNLPTRMDGDKVFYDCNPNEIRTLFEQYGEVALCKLRFGARVRDGEDGNEDLTNEKKKPGPRIPKGSCLVEYEKEEELQKAAEDTLTTKDGETVEPKRKIELKGRELVVTTLQEFLDKIKKKRKAEKSVDKDKPKDEEADEEEEKEEATFKEFTFDWKPGCVVKLEGLKDPCDREALLESVSKILEKTVDEVRGLNIYVDYSRGQTHGAIRFQEPGDMVKQVLDKLSSGDVEIAGGKVEKALILEGDDEKKYWDEFIAFKNKQMKQRAEERASRKKGGGRNKRFRRS